jgi:DNA-binding SARP family transcriptional activator
VDIYVLGDPCLRIGGRERPFPAGRPGRLLASLLVARGRVVTDGRLVDEVWGEDLRVDARAALHTTVGRPVVRSARWARASGAPLSGTGWT